MSSYLYASSTAQSINGEEYEVRIIENVAGTDSTKTFDVGPQGVKLVYENTDDTLLLPGIVHSRCEVETLWTAGDTTLSNLITNLQDSQDGDWLLEILRDDTRIWVGTILCEQVDLLESTPVQSFRIVATDGLSLLKNVDYNDNGTAYTGFHIVLDDILKNIQEKWTTWSYLDNQNGSEIRLEIADDVYSTDDYIMSLLTHPGGTFYYNTRRMRIHTHAFSQTDNAGNTTFISCYDLLQSICLTLQMRLYYYGDTWSFIPVNLSDEAITGNQLTYQDQFLTNTIVGTFNYQETLTTRTALKGNEWVQSFTPQINKIKLTRDTNKGYEIIAAYNLANGIVLTQNTLSFEGQDTVASDEAYMLRFTAYIENTALSKPESERLGRFVLKFRIQFGTGGTATYYKNAIAASPGGRLQDYELDLTSNFNSQDYAEFTFPHIGYSASVGDYYYHRSDNSNYYYDFNTAGTRYLEGAINVPPPLSGRTGVLIRPIIEAYNSFGFYDAAATAALTTEFKSLYFVAYSNNQLGVVPNFDWEASSTYGRGEIKLGTTHIGGLGLNMGGIQVETAAGVWSTTDNWVNQADDTDRPINELCVEEVLAAHYKSRKVERGHIVLRGSNATPSKPFARFSDRDTGEYYTALNWSLISTPCEMEVTLRKIGRNAIGITTQVNVDKEGERPATSSTQNQPSGRTPAIMYSYNTQARENFQGDWSSIIGTEIKEMYYTIGNDGQGTFLDAQGVITPGATIVRKIYVNPKGLQDRTDTGWTSPAPLQPGDNQPFSKCYELIRNYQTKEADHGSYTFMVTYSEVNEQPLLNTYTGAEAAYSLRKLNSSYTGSAISVRRTSPSPASQLIGFTASGELDTAALLAFCGSGDGFINTWFDQSGNGRNASQSTTTLQPKIVSNGVVLKVNNKPALYFASDYLDTTAFGPNPNGDVNGAAVLRWDNVTVRQSAASQWGSSSGQQNFFLQMQELVDHTRWGWRYSGSTLAYVDQPVTVAINTQYLISAKFAQDSVTALFNNAAGDVTNNPSGGQTANNSSNVLRIGGLSTNTTQLMTGYVQEFVLWSNSSAHSQQDISDDINDYYDVF